MAGRADRISAVGGRVGALMLLVVCAGCGTASDPAGFSIAAQDRYDFMDCRDIIGNRNALIAREKTLSDLAARAESSPGGVLVSYAAYRSELTQTRALIVAANRAVQKNNCDLTKK